MLNLLPESSLKKVKHEYMLRLGFVSCIAVACVLLFWIIGLVPAYIFADTRTKAVELQRETRTASVQDVMNDKDKESLAQLVAATKLVTNAPDSPLDAYSLLAEKVGEGLTIKNYLVARNVETNSFSISITGTSATRQALVDYSERIKADKRFTNVDVPISVFVVEKDTPFVLTVTYPYDISN